LKMGTGRSTVQSPPAIETMPCGSNTSTARWFQSAAADSLAPGDRSDTAGAGL
jgi:hypothetical protein